jgi:hypothetical protein
VEIAASVCYKVQAFPDVIHVQPHTRRSMKLTILTPQKSLNKASEDQQAPIVERVQQILATPDAPEVPQLEAEIDQLVYALYDLTDEEIALVERKA